MADEIKLSTPRAMTGRLGSLSQTGNLDEAAAPASAQRTPTDRLRLSSDAAQAAPADLAAASDLAKKVGAIQDEQRSVGEIQARIQALVPGGLKFETEGGATWKSHEMQSLLEVVEGMSPADRQVLSGMNMVRSSKVEMDAAGATASGDKVGQGFAEASKESAGGAARMGTQHKGGFLSRVGDFVRHSAEVMEGVPILRYLGKALTSMFGKPAPERAIVIGDTGSLVSKDIWAHEIGHQVQMVNYNWNPERIAEFSKLSGWTETVNGRSQVADGIDHSTGQKLEFDPHALKSERSDNFVSKYAATGPMEDFAESYRTFTTNPQELMKAAPEKFLFINAQSQKFTPDQVKALAQKTGQNLDAVATELVVSGKLKQSTLNALVGVNGLQPDKSAVIADAAGQVSNGDPLRQAWAKLALASRSPETAQAAFSNPQQALGDLWNRLSQDDRAVLSDGKFMAARRDELLAGQASATSTADATQHEVYRKGTSALVRKLMDDTAFRAQLGSDPAAALRAAGLDHQLPPEVVSAFSRNPEATKQFASAFDKLLNGASEADRSKYLTNLEKAIPALAPENFEAFVTALNNPKDPGLAGRMVTQALQTGSVVYQEGSEPPFG